MMESLSLLARRTAQQSRPYIKPLARARLRRPSPLLQSQFSSLRPCPSSSSSLQGSIARHKHTTPLRFSSSSTSSSSSTTASSSPSSLSVPSQSQSTPNTNDNIDLTPSYRLTFTCKPCSTRSTHRVSKQGYHHGTVLITCPECKNRHLIADHLKIFLDKPSTLEDILQQAATDAGTGTGTSKGGVSVNGKPLASLLKRGKLGIRQGQLVGNEGEEDIEFWEDGTETVGEVDRGVTAPSSSSTSEEKR